MSEQAGGRARFTGPGRQWKSGWRGRTIYSEICCASGFATDVAGQFYENDTALPLVPADGFFLGAVVGVSEEPAGNEPIAVNGNVANEGYELVMFSQAATGGAPGVGFTFRVFGGAGLVGTATTSAGVPLYTAAEAQLLGPTRLVVVMATFAPPSGSFPNGQVAIQTRSGSGVDTLSGAYVNSDPRLVVGVNGADAFSAPNCIAGLVGGELLFTEGQLVAETTTLRDDWTRAIQSASRVVAVPDEQAWAGFANLGGWRFEGVAPFTAAPDPLPSFVGLSDDLIYGNTDPLARSLDIGCVSPVQVEALQYPFV